MGQSINYLNQGTPDTSCQVPFYDPAQGQDRRCSVSALLGLAEGAAGGLVTQYAAPNASGFTVAVGSAFPNGTSTFLLLTPLAGYAAGTLTLPAQATCTDGQELLVHATQSVTALTVSGNGATVNGAPTTLAQFAFFRLRYDGVNAAWYRVG